MTVLPMLAVSFAMNVVAVIFAISSLLLILIVLVQKGKGGGLGAAFGGGLAGGLLGSKTGDFLTWLTIAMVSIFLLLAVVMAKYYKPTVSNFRPNQPPQTQQLPAEQGTPQQPPAQPLPETTPEGGSEVIDFNSLEE